MLQKSDAFLLKKQDIRETSLFATFYTKGFGRIYGIMKGVRGQKGQYNANPQIFSLNEIVFYERKTKDVFTVSQCELKEFFGSLRESLERTSYATYFIELINLLTPLREKNERMFELLENGLGLLGSPASAKRVARIFEIKLLGMLGLMPELKCCVVCDRGLNKAARFSLRNGGVICEACSSKERDGLPVLSGTINFMEHINRSDWPMILRIKVSQDVGHQVETLLRNFINYHLHIRPKTLEFMRKTHIIAE